MNAFVVIILVVAIGSIVLWRYRVNRLEKLFEQAVTHIKKEEINLLQGCFSRGLGIYARDEAKNTLLHIAAKENSDKIIPLLLSLGCDINAKNKYGKTPLEAAFLEGNEKSTCCLIENGADSNEGKINETTLLQRVAYQNNIALLQEHEKRIRYSHRLLFGEKSPVQEHVDKHFNDWRSRCENANPIIADCLIEHGADYNRVNEKGVSVLDFAAKSSFSYLVKRLLKLGAKFTHNSHKDLCDTVSMAGDCDSLRILVDKGVSFPETSIFFATISGNVEAVEIISSTESSDINFQNQKGWTPLMQAIQDENIAMVKLLIDRGAQINLAEQHGLAALHVACAIGSVEIVSILLQEGANPNQKAPNGCAPIKVNCDKNGEIIKELLIRAGAES